MGRETEMDLALTNTRQMHADALRDNEALAARNRVLEEALSEVQWSNGGFCPQCDRGVKKGHHPKCSIGAALEAAPCTKQG